MWEVARALGQALDRVGSSLQRDLQGRAFGGDGSGTPAGVAKVRGSSRHAWRLPRTQHRVSGRQAQTLRTSSGRVMLFLGFVSCLRQLCRYCLWVCYMFPGQGCHCTCASFLDC